MSHPDVRTEHIDFPNGRHAVAAFPVSSDLASKVVTALALPPYRAVILVIGGADGLTPWTQNALMQLFDRGIARAAADVNAIVLDGGTQAGVMQMMGEAVADNEYALPLVGVAPVGAVRYPPEEDAGGAVVTLRPLLEPNHTHFVLTNGTQFGEETKTLFQLLEALTHAPHREKAVRSVVILAAGGAVAKAEVVQAVRQHRKVIVITGSGGLADEIADAWAKRDTETSNDPALAEIIDEGNLRFHNLSAPVKGMAGRIHRELGDDSLLLMAWQKFADYDAAANQYRNRSDLLQITIICLGVLGTGLAVLHSDIKPPVGSGWWALGVQQFWNALPYILIVIPIVLTILVAAASRFKLANKWLLLRSGAQSIKREIYRYRVFALYDIEIARLELAKKMQEVTTKTMTTEVNTTSIKRYKGPIPPHIKTNKIADDGLSFLTPERYVDVRIGNDLHYFEDATGALKRNATWLNWAILLVGGVGTYLAAEKHPLWIAMTTALATAAATYLSYRQTENSLVKYNQTANNLHNVIAWWTSLPSEDQARMLTVRLLVEQTEQILQSELDGWVQQMQNALAQLYKDESHPNDGRPGGAPSK